MISRLAQLQTGVQTLGVVKAAGSQVAEFSPGDTVYLRTGHGSHQVVPASECSPVPDGLDLKQACWCGLAKTAFRAAWAGGFQAGTDVLVIGAGPVGQMVTRCAAAGGATELFCGNMVEQLPQIQLLNNGKGPSIVVDSTGSPATLQPALAVAARFGKVILLGDTGYPSRQCLSSDLMMKGLSLPPMIVMTGTAGPSALSMNSFLRPWPKTGFPWAL